MASRWGNNGNGDRLYFLGGSKITADGDCSHEIKRRLLLGRKVMTNLDSILKSRDVTLPTKVHLVKAMVFPVVMYRCESWTMKKAERQRFYAFELGCWRRLLIFPWTARRSNQSILNEINPEYSLEGLILKLKLQYWPLDTKSWLTGKDPDAGEDWRQKKRVTEDEMVLPTQWTWVGANSRREWRTGTSDLLPSMAKRQTRLSDGTRITVRRCGAKTQIQVCLTPELHEYLVMMLHTDF